MTTKTKTRSTHHECTLCDRGRTAFAREIESAALKRGALVAFGRFGDSSNFVALVMVPDRAEPACEIHQYPRPSRLRDGQACTVARSRKTGRAQAITSWTQLEDVIRAGTSRREL